MFNRAKNDRRLKVDFVHVKGSCWQKRISHKQVKWRLRAVEE